jgi:hypothetical protein
MSAALPSPGVSLGRRCCPRLALANVRASAAAALYHGGSPCAAHWRETVIELRTLAVARLPARLPDEDPRNAR